MNKKHLILLLVFLFITRSAFAQTIFTDLKSLEKRGDYYYSKLSYAKAIDFYSQALQKKRNKSNVQLNFKTAGLYRKMGRYEEAKKCYDQIIASGYRFNSRDSINYFNILKATAPLSADSFLPNQFSRKILNSLYRDTLFYHVSELPFNTSKSEYCSLIFNNGLLYVADKTPNSLVEKFNALNNGGFASLQFAEKKDTAWLTPREISTDIKDLLHVGPIALYDNETKAILNVCIEDEEKPYRLGLYQAEYDKEKEQWKGVSPLSLNNPSYSIGHPALSNDGKKIFYISDKSGGIGGTDVYYSYFLNGQWSAPLNLGAKINTPGNEKYPFINKDNVLFFSSDGRYGMGGLDIYCVDLNFKDSLVVNMGFPVNSNLDDFGFNYDDNSKTGFFSSNRKSFGKEDDLYEYKENNIYLTVTLKDDFDKSDLEDAIVRIYDAELDVPVRFVQENKKNVIKARLRPAHIYKLCIQKEDYKSDTLMISTYEIRDYSKPVNKTVYVKRKSVYYAALNYQDGESEVSIDNTVIILNNLTDNKIDSIDHKGVFMKVKLDADCEYIITSRNKNSLRYIYVEKKSDKYISSKSYYNMYLTPAKPSVIRIIVKKCSGEVAEENLKLRVFDRVNRNQFYISPGPDGDFQFVVTDSRLFDLYLNSNKILYSKQKIHSSGYCMSFIEN